MENSKGKEGERREVLSLTGNIRRQGIVFWLDPHEDSRFQTSCSLMDRASFSPTVTLWWDFYATAVSEPVLCFVCVHLPLETRP